LPSNRDHGAGMSPAVQQVPDWQSRGVASCSCGNPSNCSRSCSSSSCFRCRARRWSDCRCTCAWWSCRTRLIPDRSSRGSSIRRKAPAMRAYPPSTCTGRCRRSRRGPTLCRSRPGCPRRSSRTGSGRRAEGGRERRRDRGARSPPPGPEDAARVAGAGRAAALRPGGRASSPRRRSDRRGTRPRSHAVDRVEGRSARPGARSDRSGTRTARSPEPARTSLGP
jgi:hypothetical protein